VAARFFSLTDTVLLFVILWCSPEAAACQEQPYPEVEILWEVRLGNGTTEIWKEFIRGVPSGGSGSTIVSSVYRPPGTLIWSWKVDFVDQSLLFSTVSEISPRSYLIQNRSHLERAVVHYENRSFVECTPGEMNMGELHFAGGSLGSIIWRSTCFLDAPSGRLYFTGVGITEEIWSVGPLEGNCSVVTEHWISNKNPIIPGARRVHGQCMGTTAWEAFMIPLDIRVEPTNGTVEQ
jgi:hypothetical protein